MIIIRFVIIIKILLAAKNYTSINRTFCKVDAPFWGSSRWRVDGSADRVERRANVVNQIGGNSAVFHALRPALYALRASVRRRRNGGTGGGRTGLPEYSVF